MCPEPDGEDWTRNELQGDKADGKSNQNNDQRFVSCVDAHSHTDTNARGAFNAATNTPTPQPRGGTEEPTARSRTSATVERNGGRESVSSQFTFVGNQHADLHAGIDYRLKSL